MYCPPCQSAQAPERPEHMELGYRRSRCRRCHREFNERTGPPCNRLPYPSDIVCLTYQESIEPRPGPYSHRSPYQ